MPNLLFPGVNIHGRQGSNICFNVKNILNLLQYSPGTIFSRNKRKKYLCWLFQQALKWISNFKKKIIEVEKNLNGLKIQYATDFSSIYRVSVGWAQGKMAKSENTVSKLKHLLNLFSSLWESIVLNGSRSHLWTNHHIQSNEKYWLT